MHAEWLDAAKFAIRACVSRAKASVGFCADYARIVDARSRDNLPPPAYKMSALRAECVMWGLATLSKYFGILGSCGNVAKELENSAKRLNFGGFKLKSTFRI